MCAAPMGMLAAGGRVSSGDMLASWAQGLGSGRVRAPGPESLRFVFYGRVSTEDWQDPVTSRARQLQQAVMLVAGRGTIVAEFFDCGESRTLAWACRPQAAALVAQLADPDRGWNAIVTGWVTVPRLPQSDAQHFSAAKTSASTAFSAARPLAAGCLAAQIAAFGGAVARSGFRPSGHFPSSDRVLDSRRSTRPATASRRDHQVNAISSDQA